MLGANPAQNGGALKQTHYDLHHNQPDDNPLQPRAVGGVLVVTQHVQHLLQHLRMRPSPAHLTFSRMIVFRQWQCCQARTSCVGREERCCLIVVVGSHTMF